MNCDTVDSILDDHRSPQLSPTERQDLAAHLAACVRCAGVWGVHDALAGEQIAEPPPELFARVLGSVSAGRSRSNATRHRGWRIGVAAAAVVALVAVIARYAPLDFGAIPHLNAASEAMLRRMGALGAAADGRSPERTGVTAPVARRFVAGRDYEVLAAVIPQAADVERVAVTEFFMFWCDPCYAFERELARWSAGMSGQVALTRVPVLFNTEAALHARAFYTAEALGKLDAMHPAFYDEMHVRGNRLSSREALAGFFARFDVDGATFGAVFDSGDVDARVRRAVALTREYGIDGVPALVVAGRYVTSPGMAGPEVLAVVDQLVAEEAASRRD